MIVKIFDEQFASHAEDKANEWLSQNPELTILSTSVFSTTRIEHNLNGDITQTWNQFVLTIVAKHL